MTTGCTVDAELLHRICSLHKGIQGLDYISLRNDELSMIRDLIKNCEQESKDEVYWDATVKILEKIITYEPERQELIYDKWQMYFQKEKKLDNILNAVDAFYENGTLPRKTTVATQKAKTPMGLSLWLGSFLVGVKMPPFAAATAAATCGLFNLVCKCANDNREAISMLMEIVPMIAPSVMNPYYIKLFQQSLRLLTFLDKNPKKMSMKLLKYSIQNYKKNEKIIQNAPSTDASSPLKMQGERKLDYYEKVFHVQHPTHDSIRKVKTNKVKSKTTPKEKDSKQQKAEQVQEKQQKKDQMKKTQLTSKYSSILTKSLNKGIGMVMEQLEGSLTSNPYVVQHPEVLPIAIGLLYGLRKSIVIEKYHSLTRAFNNYFRRCLGQKIKPTKETPFELLKSGKVYPILRRDLLMSNLLVVYALFANKINAHIKELIVDEEDEN